MWELARWSSDLWSEKFRCAWHDALASLLVVETPEVKHPPYGTEGQRQQGKGSYQKWGVRRKHEAEPMYVANSEPTIWQWGGGRAGVAEQDLISGEPNRCEVGWHMGRWCVLPREALLAWWPETAIGIIKPHRQGEPEAGRGQRVADPRVVLMTQGRWSLVTVWRRKAWRPGRERRLFPKPGWPTIVGGTWKDVDERRQWHHWGVEIVLQQLRNQKTKRGCSNPAFDGIPIRRT